MRDLKHDALTVEWHDAVRRAAIIAVSDSQRKLWLAALATCAVLVFGILVAIWPAGVDLASPGVNEIQQVVDQARGLGSGTLSPDGLYPLAYPLWPLLLARFSGDVALAARIASGLSAVLALFLAYQFCHTLSDAERADEQACFALLALVLSPSFLRSAAGGGPEMPHLALLLSTLLCLQHAHGRSAATPMTLAGLLAGLSLLLRPISLLLLPTVLLWLWWSRPFDSDEPAANLRPGLGFAAAFLVGASPLALMSLTQHTSLLPWGWPELGLLWDRFTSQPFVVLSGLADSLVQYLTADDAERLAAVGGSWQAGAWSNLVSALISLAPTLLKLIGALSLICLCWFERFETAVERVRLPALLLVLFAVASAPGLVDGRSLLPVEALLIVVAFAGLPSLVPGVVCGVVGLALVGLMLFHQVGAGYPVQLAPAYRSSDQVALQLREAGATPNRVMSTSWNFYDTRSPWHERYRHVPIYVNSVDVLVREMRRQGAAYLVFDRQAGADQWPRLAGLLETEHPHAGLRALQPALRTDGSPPNLVAIYKLE